MIVQTLKLKISDKVYDNIVWFLSKFNKDEVEIISDTESFSNNQAYLQNELDEILTGKAELHSIEEFEQQLDEVIK